MRNAAGVPSRQLRSELMAVACVRRRFERSESVHRRKSPHLFLSLPASLCTPDSPLSGFSLGNFVKK